MNNNGIKRWMSAMDFFRKYWGCHQLPQRSFFYHDYQFPICARCTGIIIGYFTAGLLLLTNIKLDLLTAFFFILPTGIDGTVQYCCEKYESNNRRRLLTGIIAGIGIINVVFIIIKSIIHIIID